jgi:PAS domain S-box-containing protein
MNAFKDHEIYRRMLEDLPAGLCVVDVQKKIVLWSSGAERMTGHLRHEIIGHSCVAEPLLHCDQPGCEFCDEHCPVAKAMKTSQGVDATGFMRHKDGHEIPVRIRAVPVHNQHGSIIGALETLEELQSGINRERGDASPSPDYLDNVTGVASRPMMQAHLQARLAALPQAKVAPWVLLIQVHGLAHFRASLGMEAASSLLRVMVRTVESSIWTSDLIGRWSDDQFLLIVDGSREEKIQTFGERIRRTLAAEGIEWWGERRTLPLRIAGTEAKPGDTVESVLHRLHSLMAASGLSTENCLCAAPSSGS